MQYDYIEEPGNYIISLIKRYNNYSNLDVDNRNIGKVNKYLLSIIILKIGI